MDELRIEPKIIEVGRTTIIELWQNGKLVSKLEFTSEYFALIDVYINKHYIGQSVADNLRLHWNPLKG